MFDEKCDQRKTAEAAYDLAANYGLPVFACLLDKRPATPNGFKDATTNLDELDGRFIGERLVGIPTGKASSLFVIDIDPAGQEWYREHFERLKCGYVQHTRRGFHLYFRYPANIEIRNSASKLATGVDVRGEGGYVIAWSAAGLPAVGSWEDIGDAPDWLLDTLVKPELRRDAPKSNGACVEGQRNDSLFRLSCRLRRNGLDTSEISAALQARNMAHCQPPLDEVEVERIAASSGRYEPHGEAGDEPAPELALAAFTADQLLAPILPERYLIPGMVPAESYTLIAGALSSCKTMLLHALMLWRATGYDLLDFGGPHGSGIDIGPCVLVSYEDSDARIVRRFQRLVQHQHAAILRVHGHASATEYLGRVVKHVRRVTLTGTVGAGLVQKVAGMIVPNTPQLERMVAAVGEFAASGVLIGLDPLRLAIQGSQNDDDGADTVVHVLNHLACALPDSGLVVPSHTTKAMATEQTSSLAAAAYATSGSALYSQHARSNFHLARQRSEDMRARFPPGSFTDEEIDRQLAVQLTHARLSHGPESAKRHFALRDGVLVAVAPASGGLDVMERGRVYLPLLADALNRLRDAGAVLSRNALRNDLGLVSRLPRKRDGLDDFMRLALEQGWVEESGQGRAKHISLTAKGENLAGIVSRGSPT